MKSAFYVSKAFYQASGCDISEVMCGRYHLKFNKPIMTSGEQNDFIESLNLGKQQALYFTGNMGFSISIFCGLCGLVLVTCLCAYLLIYNIMYLSVAGNVRYYGLLQTVGMAVFIATVCAGIPVIAGAGMVHKGSVVERVRGA